MTINELSSIYFEEGETVITEWHNIAVVGANGSIFFSAKYKPKDIKFYRFLHNWTVVMSPRHASSN